MRSETPVLIVGGGPPGLAASLTLSQLGVPSMLVNKYPGTLEHPKAVGLMQRTSELLRPGAPRRRCAARRPARVLRPHGLDDHAGRRGAGRTETIEPDDHAPEPQSPTTGLRCPQNITETALRRAESHEIADLHYGFEMTAFEQDDDGVTATVVARDGGERAPSARST